MKHKNFACEKAKVCGGCQLQNMTYPEQLEYKQHKVSRYLDRFAKPKAIIGAAHPEHYRNKVQAAYKRSKNGEIISGVYQSNSHKVIKVDSCLIEDELADKIIVYIRQLLKSFKLTVYDEDKKKGFLRHVLVKRARATGETMVVLVAGSSIFPSKNNFVKALTEKFPEITTVIFNLNNRSTSLVLGDKQEILYGSGKITDILCGKKFLISPKSFYQINPEQTEILYSKAIEAARLTGNETVIDAYCGIGTIGIVASDKAKRVIGVELNPDAVRDAKQNARLNNIENIDFYCGDAGEFMTEMSKNGEKLDLLLMDPPRAGASKEFLESTKLLAPKKIVYISCNVETQSRDLKVLKDMYKVTLLQPVDMFPYTNHVENIAVLIRKDTL